MNISARVIYFSLWIFDILILFYRNANLHTYTYTFLILFTHNIILDSVSDFFICHFIRSKWHMNIRFSRCNSNESYKWYFVLKLLEILHAYVIKMDFCKRYKFLHILPRPAKRIVWFWRAENGTVFQVPENDLQLTTECFVELMNNCVTIFTILVAAILIFKYKCNAIRK